MKKLLFILPIVLTIYICSVGLCAQNVTEFSHKIREIKLKQDSENVAISSAEIKELLGEPAAKNDDSLQIKNQKEVWAYFHPEMATVRYLFVFDNYDNLIMLTCVQNITGTADTFYSIEHFLSQEPASK